MANEPKLAPRASLHPRARSTSNSIVFRGALASCSTPLGRALSHDLMGRFPDHEPDTVQEPTPVFSYKLDALHIVLCRKNTAIDCKCDTVEEETSEFEKQIGKQWDRAVKQKVFNYKLNLMYKLLPGRYLFSAQLNAERGNLRRKPHAFRSLDDQFDNRRFNYHKIRRREVLLDLRCSDRPVTDDPLDRHMVITNASPVERWHCLVLPAIDLCHIQRITPECVRLMLDTLLLTRSLKMTILFNSLLAFASVNHLHFHLVFWPYQTPLIRKANPGIRRLEFPKFEFTRTRLQPVAHIECGVHALYAPDPWFVPAFVLQLQSREDIGAFIRTTTAVCNFLHASGIPHNVFMCRAPALTVIDGNEARKHWDDRTLIIQRLGKHDPYYATMYIFPRKSVPGAKPMNKFSPAACELAGNLLVYNERFFHCLNEKDVLRIIEDECGLPVGAFETLVDTLRQHLLVATQESSKNVPFLRPLSDRMADTENATVNHEVIEQRLGAGMSFGAFLE